MTISISSQTDRHTTLFINFSPTAAIKIGCLSKKFDFDQSLILVSSEKELGFDIASLYKRQVVNQISNTHECLIFKNSGFTEDLADYFIQLKKHELVISLWQKSDYVSPHDLCLTFHSDNVIAKFEKE